jgi:FkbM family methyltransferase
MKSMLKTGLRSLVNGVLALLGSNRVGRLMYAQMIDSIMRRTQTVEYRGVRLSLAVPNAQNKFRADTFATKEPETLEWISAIPEGAVIWDIGANVGLYSCFAAKSRGCRVFAFEPSVFNLEMLARNTYLNGVTQLVTIIPLPLSSGLGVSTLNMTNTEWGGALSTFGESYGYDGRPLDKAFGFSTMGVSMDQAADLLKIPLPRYIKMDVDGIEHLILRGGVSVLQQVDGVLIEINDAFQEQADGARRYLTAAGLQLKDKRRWEAMAGSGFESAFNQIWHRGEGR